jgi:hypothetical protein
MRSTKSRPPGLDLFGNGQVVPTKEQLEAAWLLYYRLNRFIFYGHQVLSRRFARTLPYRRTRRRRLSQHVSDVEQRAFARYEAMYHLYYERHPDW